MRQSQTQANGGTSEAFSAKAGRKNNDTNTTNGVAPANAQADKVIGFFQSGTKI